MLPPGWRPLVAGCGISPPVHHVIRWERGLKPALQILPLSVSSYSSSSHSGGTFCADQTGNIVSDWRSEPSSGNTKRLSSSLSTFQSCSLFGPPSHPQKFRAVWVWLPPSQDAPPSPEAPPSWRRRVKMLRRRWWTPSARLASPASSSAPPSVSEHSCTARCSSTWPPKHTEQERHPTSSEPHPQSLIDLTNTTRIGQSVDE